MEYKGFKLVSTCSCGTDNTPQELYITDQKALMVRCSCRRCKQLYWVDFDLAELIIKCPQPSDPQGFTEDDRSFLMALRIEAK